MNHFEIDRLEFRYPTTRYIQVNEPQFFKLFMEFLSRARTDIEKKEVIELVCMGASGTVISTLFYIWLKTEFPLHRIEISQCRKTHENCHSRNDIKIWSNQTLYVWIDDHIDCANTVRSCIHRYQAMTTFEYDDNFRFDWAVCLSSEFSVNYSSQIKLFEEFTHNMICATSHYCIDRYLPKNNEQLTL